MGIKWLSQDYRHGGGGGGVRYFQEPFGAHSTKFGSKRLSKLVIHNHITYCPHTVQTCIQTYKMHKDKSAPPTHPPKQSYILTQLQALAGKLQINRNPTKSRKTNHLIFNAWSTKVILGSQETNPIQLQVKPWFTVYELWWIHVCWRGLGKIRTECTEKTKT